MSIEISSTATGYLLKASTRLNGDREKIFAFFADANNLDRLTPSRLRFKILTPQPIEMKRGTRIDYSLRIHGIPIRWQSEISLWEPPFRFVDEQVKGPYRCWRHEHRFEVTGEDTIVHDEVNYQILCGSIVHPLVVRGDLLKIFQFRQETMQTFLSDRPF